MHRSPQIVLALSLAVLSGCASEAQKQSNEIRAARGADTLTLGTVQREVRVGMAGSEVAEALGSPNVVTTDPEGREVWIYERFARDVTSSDAGFFVIIFGTGNRSRSVSQRSLTVIVKYDDNNFVRDVAYHSTSF